MPVALQRLKTNHKRKAMTLSNTLVRTLGRTADGALSSAASQHEEERKVRPAANATDLAAMLSDLASGSAAAVFRPVLFRLRECDSVDQLRCALRGMPQVVLFDSLAAQLEELAKIRNPQGKLSRAEAVARAARMVGGGTSAEYGVWAYYPWSFRLVHLLDEQEFVELRTNRNLYKITPAERDVLATKRVGVIGLSVGQSIALTLAIERGFGEIRLADFDTLDLSNLNRLRAGVHNLGVPKVYVAAREIAEIDPYLRVECFPEGIGEGNLDRFLVGTGKLDVLVEECDSLDIKFLARERARVHGIPVLMDTSDRGLLDIERFDLEPQRPLFHGLAGSVDGRALRGLTSEQKVPYVLSILGTTTTSARLRASMLEIDQTLTSWPQLASSVALGGAMCADVCRRMLLGDPIPSGRHYVDLDQLVPAEQAGPAPRVEISHPVPGTPVPTEVLLEATRAAHWSAGAQVGRECVAQLVDAGITAPSGGNGQPWQWRFADRTLFLLPDLSRETPWLGAEGRATQLALGAAAENVVLFARTRGLHARLLTPRTPDEFPFSAAFQFSELQNGAPSDAQLASMIRDRCTNRRFVPRSPLPAGALEGIVMAAQGISGVRCHVLQQAQELDAIKEILGAAQQAQLLNAQSHRLLVDEVRWSEEQALARRDGIDIPSLALSPSDRAGLEILRDWEPVSLLAQLGLGRGLRRLMSKAVDSASAVVLVTMPDASHASYFDGGRAVQRAWLAATQCGVAFQPIGPLAYMFARLHSLNGKDLAPELKAALRALWPRYKALFGVDEDCGQAILFRLFVADPAPARSLRRPVTEVLDFA